METPDAIKPDEQRVSNLLPSATLDLHDPEQVVLHQGIHAGWWWGVGVLAVPFLTMSIHIVLMESVRSVAYDAAPACVVGIGLGMFCIFRLPVSRVARLALACAYAPFAGVLVRIYGFLFAFTFYDFYF
jgi:hypothetical protein